MSGGKPIIGIVGGIGSGKTFVARLFGELGCLGIEADELVRAAYDEPAIRDILRQWWGDEVFLPNGALNRAAVAQKIFSDLQQRTRLEGLIHPWVDARRREMMERAGADTVAFVWDTPLLVEAGLHRNCDAVVYVDAPESERVARVKAQRGWDLAELSRREILQIPLDKKREISDHVIVNTAGGAIKEAPEADQASSDARVSNQVRDRIRTQVREILSRIVAGLPKCP